MAFVKVAELGDVKPGTGRVVRAGGKELALFLVDGAFYCIDNDCPHREGPLGEGDLEGDTVICPWHAYEYDPCTGSPPAGFSDAAHPYPTRTTASGGLEVGLPTVVERPSEILPAFAIVDP